MTIDDALIEFELALDAKLPVLVAEIQRVIVDLPFDLADVPKSSVDAIHFEYDFPSFLPVAIPLNATTGYCAPGELLSLLSQFETDLVPEGFRGEVLEEIAEQDQDEALNALNDAMDEMYRDWFARCWQLARAANPRIRGFLSIHDLTSRLDLDTGEELEEDTGPVVFFPRKPSK
jgi:hypothetical protein